MFTPMSDNILAAHVAQHPRLAGVLFTTLLCLSQAGTALAGHGAAYPGP